MAIKFICGCGKHLKARDEMAARRSVCPRCGAPVGIPSLQPSAPGAPLGPMTPDERRRHAKNRVPQPDAVTAVPLPARRADAPEPAPDARPPRPPDHREVRRALPPEPEVRRIEWQPEKTWADCLLYPFRAWLLVAGFAVALSVLSAGLVLVLPQAAAEGPDTLGLLLLCSPVLILSGLALCYLCGFVQCAFVAAAAGDARQVRWPGRDAVLALRSGLTWLVCFLAGPVVPAAAAFWYWLHGGDLRFLDWLIIAELALVALAWWLLTLLAVSRRERLLDAHPLAVAGVVQRLGHRVVAAALVGAGVALAHGLLVLAALEKLHHDGAAFVLVLLCWASLLMATTFLFRLLGLWCRLCRFFADDAIAGPGSEVGEPA